MKKTLLLFAVTTLLASQLLAYWVVMKDGTRYEAKAKPTVSGGKARITLVTGQVIVVDATAIDNAKSEEMTRLGGGSLLAEQPAPATALRPGASLGSQVKLRPQPGVTTTSTAPSNQGYTGPTLGPDVVDKFERAYENVGIYEHKMTTPGPRSLRADLTTDSEETVFNAISATALLVVHNAGLSGVSIDQVDIFMKMTNGGAAGRFQMTRADAEALYTGGTSPSRTKLQEYFVQKVIF